MILNNNNKIYKNNKISYNKIKNKILFKMFNNYNRNKKIITKIIRKTEEEKTILILIINSIFKKEKSNQKVITKEKNIQPVSYLFVLTKIQKNLIFYSA